MGYILYYDLEYRVIQKSLCTCENRTIFLMVNLLMVTNYKKCWLRSYTLLRHQGHVLVCACMHSDLKHSVLKTIGYAHQGINHK
jgi:hypothetical protein